MRGAALLLPASLAMLLVACGDKSDADDSPTDSAPENESPTASIGSHADGDTEREGYAFTLVGSVADADGSLSELDIAWTADGEPLCEGSAADEDGTVSCTTDLAPGDAEIALTVTDADGASGSDVVSLTINSTDAPAAEITGPDTNGRYYADIPVELTAVIGDSEDAVEDLEVSWSSSLAPDSPFTLDIDADGNVSAQASLAEGSHVLTLQVTDTTGKTSTSSVEISVGAANSAPLCAIDSPADGFAALEGAEVVFSGSAVDADIDAEDIDIAWTSDVDGMLDATSGDASGIVGFASTALSTGPHSITLTATDETGAACSESISVFIGNAPAVAISAPSDDDIFDEGEEIAFAGTVADAEDLAEDLEISWSIDAGPVLDQSSADSAGNAGFSIASLAWGEYSVIFSATDSHGFVSTDEVSITVNGLPSAPGVSFTASAPDTTADLVVNIDTDSIDPEGESVSYTYAWAKDGVATSETGSTLSSALTSRGEVWTASVAGMDARAAGAATDISITIGNALPELTDVSLSPSDAAVTDDIVCSPSSSDADGDSVTYTYAWTIDGVASSETGSTLSAGSATTGQTVICEVTPNDGMDDGAALASAGMTIANTAPEISAVDVTPADPSTDDTITCAVTASDVDGDSLTTSYTWLVNGVDIGISGDTLDPSYFFKSDTIACEATVDDGTDSSDPVSSAVLTVDNSIPEIASVTINPAPARVADDLSCDVVSSDADGDTVTLTYAWTINGSAAGTSQTLASGAFSRGDVIGCTATPDDGTDTGSAVSSASMTVQNTAPEVKTLSLGPTDATSGETLTCAATGQDADHDGVGFTYAWTVDGVDTGTTSDTLDPSYFYRGAVVTCEATPYDSADTGTPETSNSVTILNGAPSVSSVSITPASPVSGDTLTCGVVSADPDGDTVNIAYTWAINGVDAGVTTDTLGSSFVNKGDSIACTATPSDATDTGTMVASAPVSVINTAPELTGIAMTPSTPATTDDLTCVPSATDADGDTVSYSYAWYKNGVDMGVPTNSLLSSNFSRDDVITCEVTPTDGTDAGATDTLQVTIANTAPVLSSASIPNTSPTTDTVLTASGATSDIDGDTVSINWDWYVNGAKVTSGASFAGAAYFSKGDSVHAVGTPTDGTTDGASVTTAAVTVLNSAPSAPVVYIDPADPTESDDLVCVVDTPSVDADGDSIFYAVSWEKNGVSWTGATSTDTMAGDTISSADTVGEEEWSCYVTPTDGSAIGDFGDDVVEVLPAQRVYYIDAVDLLNAGGTCSGYSDDYRQVTGGLELGFDWLDLDTRTPANVTIEFGIAWDCGWLFSETTRDIELNGVAIDTYNIDPSYCSCSDAANAPEVLESSTGVLVLGEYLVDDVNTISFPVDSAGNGYGQAIARMPSLGDYYAKITVDY